ncbi:MAG: PKD domain-containing protein [Bacteroidetes bacterium]|nr:PKD domain-containing protein [Bacteroidota bacterium]
MPTNLNANFYEVIACMNEARFIDSSYVMTGTPIQQWHWEFGDGNTSSDQHPVHIYSAPGNYAVRLIVFNSNCSDTLIKNIYIWPAPSVDYTFVAGCVDDTSFFNSTTSIISGTLQQYIWDFGDTTSNIFTSTAQHVSQLQDRLRLLYMWNQIMVAEILYKRFYCRGSNPEQT